MLNSIQIWLIRWILQPLYRIKKIIPESVWPVIAAGSVVGMVLLRFAQEAGIISRYLMILAPFCLLFGIFILAGLKADMKPLKLSPVMMICWFGVGAMALITGVLVNHDCLGDAMLWLVAFPVFFVVWGNRPVKEMVRPITNGLFIVFGICTVINLLFFPVGAKHYSGMFVNSNSLAMFVITVYVVALIDLLSQKKFGVRIVLADLVMAFAVMFVMYSNSRAGMYVMAIATVCGVVMFLTSEKIKIWKVILSHILPAVLAVVIVMSFGSQIVYTGAQLGKVILSTEAKKESSQNKASNKANKVKDDKVKTEKSINDILNYNKERLTQGQGEDLNSFTTGRVTLWKIHLKEVGVLGNPADKVLYRDNGKVETRSAHMTLIQMAYEYGAPAAFFFLIFNILGGLKAVALVYRKPNEKYRLFPALIAIAYGTYYLVEKILYPATMLPLLLYMMSQAHIVAEAKTKTEA